MDRSTRGLRRGTERICAVALAVAAARALTVFPEFRSAEAIHNRKILTGACLRRSRTAKRTRALTL